MSLLIPRRLRAGLAIFYFIAGVAHIAFPAPFVMITPGWVPDASMVVILTGVCELAGALGLLLPSTRRWAAIGLAVYAVCVFPANIKHAIDSLGGPSPSLMQWAYHSIRLPLQPLIVWLALFAGEVTSWSMRQRLRETPPVSAAQASNERLSNKVDRPISASLNVSGEPER